MDTLTHALVGAALSDGVFRKRLGRVATPFALVAASLPDVDIVTYFINAESAWAYHRGYTHSIAPQLLAAPILGYVGYRLAGRMGSCLQWALLALFCLVSHTLGDLATSWGTMPLLPFSNIRVSWDLLPIIDIFLTGVTGASFVVNRVLRREKVDTFDNPMAFPVVHRYPKRRHVAMWWARVSLVVVCLYLLVAVQQHAQTVRVAREQLNANGVDAVEVRAFPILFNYIAWVIAARDAEGAVYNAESSSYAPQAMHFIRFPAARGAEVDKALSTADGRMFVWYSQGMFVAEEDPEPGVSVRLSDRRFFALSSPKRSRFIMDFAKTPSGDMERVAARQLAFEGVDVWEEVRLLWELTKTGYAHPPE